MNRGIFRLALLFITGRTRAWHQYLVCALLAILFLLSIGAARLSGDPAIAMAMVALLNAVIWGAGTAGMLATVRELRWLRVPHVYRKSGMVLGLAALFTLFMPAVLLVLTGGATSGPGTTGHVFMIPALGATTGMLVATLPLPMVGVVLWFGPLLLVTYPAIGRQLTHTALWQSAWGMEAILLPAMLIVAWRCRALIRSETTGGIAWASLAQMRINVSSLFATAAQDPNATYRMFPAWMVPSWRTRAGASLWTRISTLMGPPFAPGNLRQLLPTLAVIGGIGAVMVWFFLQQLSQQLPAQVQQIFTTGLKSQIPLAFVILLSSVSRSFAGRLRTIHRPQSANLAELALLPGLGVGRTALANYCQVLFGRPLRMLVAVTAVLGGAMAAAVHFTPWNPLLLVLIVAGLTVMEIARYMAVGRPVFQNIFVEAFAYVAVLVSIGALAFLGSRTPLVAASTSNAISYLVMPAIVVILWLTAIQVVRWAYATAGRLPHPFLDAQERRVIAVS